MNNYEFCIEWVIGQARQGRGEDRFRVLDYGCGAGQITMGLRARAIDAYGCDVFYEGGDYSAAVDRSLLGSVIRRMQGTRIPFDDASFDLVVNNQVMEHVQDLDAALDEFHRVLRPGGMVLNLFPDISVWREGHCGIPFLHRFPKHSRLRVYYAAALRSIGMGYNFEGKSIIQWSRDFCEWLDRWTYYRRYEEIAAVYSKRFDVMSHIEGDWFDARVFRKPLLAQLVPHALKQVAVRKLAGMVFVCRKTLEPADSTRSALNETAAR